MHSHLQIVEPGRCVRLARREEVEATVNSLKKGKSLRIDNIPGEVVQAEGNAVLRTLHKICYRVWQTNGTNRPWTQFLIFTLPKKVGNLQQCKNYRKISVICPLSKVMLKVLLNRLKQSWWNKRSQEASVRAQGVPQISDDGDDQRIFGGLKFLIAGFFR